MKKRCIPTIYVFIMIPTFILWCVANMTYVEHIFFFTSALYFSIDQRKCLYMYEGDLTWFKMYTESNCYLDCWWRKAVDVCGCTPWHVPSIEDIPTCFSLGNLCFQSIVKKYQKEDATAGLGKLCTHDSVIELHQLGNIFIQCHGQRK